MKIYFAVALLGFSVACASNRTRRTFIPTGSAPPPAIVLDSGHAQKMEKKSEENLNEAKSEHEQATQDLKAAKEQSKKD